MTIMITNQKKLRSTLLSPRKWTSAIHTQLFIYKREKSLQQISLLRVKKQKKVGI